MEVVECPSRADTVRIFVPAAINRLAFVCPCGIIRTNQKSPVVLGDFGICPYSFSVKKAPKSGLSEGVKNDELP